MCAFTRYWTPSFLALVFACAPHVAVAQQPNVSLSASHGSLPASAPRDWLLDPFSLFVAPGHPAISVIAVNPSNPSFPTAPPFIGRVKLTVTCCGIPGAPGLVNPGIDLRINQSLPQVFGWPRSVPAWLLERLSLTGTNIALNSASVDVKGVVQQADLSVTARPGALVGNWILWVGAEDAGGRIMSSIPLTVTVLPPWPAAGPDPRCGTARILDLSAIDPVPYAAKAKMPSLTVFTLGAKVPRAQVGLQFTIRNPAISPALAPNESIVKLINSQGRAVGVRSSTSNDCATVNPTLLAEAGGVPATLGISAAGTTTLVFSKSTCRFWLIACWSWGLDDVVQLSEGALWVLFGGREVEIETVGDWSNELQWGDWVIGGIGF
jgi:hypothetical protein